MNLESQPLARFRSVATEKLKHAVRTGVAQSDGNQPALHVDHFHVALVHLSPASFIAERVAKRNTCIGGIPFVPGSASLCDTAAANVSFSLASAVLLLTHAA